MIDGLVVVVTWNSHEQISGTEPLDPSPSTISKGCAILHVVLPWFLCDQRNHDVHDVCHGRTRYQMTADLAEETV